MKPFFIFALLLCALPANAITYADWIASYGLSGSDAATTADPDHDGVPNLMEYALSGMGPNVSDAKSPSMPRIAFMRRTGPAIGQWEFASFTKPPSNGYNGRWHVALQYAPRPGVEGIVYVPEVGDLTLRRWFDGRSAIRSEVYPGLVISVCLAQGQRHKRMFMRLGVELDDDVGDALAGLTVGGLNAQSLDTGTATPVARVIAQASSSVVTTQDVTVTRSAGATTVTDYVWNWTPNGHNVLPTSVVRSSSNPAVIAPHATDPYRWTWTGNGTATLQLATATAIYTADVTTSTATGATADTYLSTTASTMRAQVETHIDTLLAGKTASVALPIFSTQNHAAGVYVRNASCWAAGVDLTPISPWNSSGGAYNAGILISPRHVLFATHYLPATGCTMRFVKADNTVVTRTLTAMVSLSTTADYYPDMTVGVLDSDVPAGIGFARVLPDNWASYLPTLATRPLPTVGTDQEEKLLVRELSTLTNPPGARAVYAVPADQQRRAFYEDVISGDSGNPSCLIVGNQLVLLNLWTFGGAGQGTSVQAFRTALQSAMTTLGGGYTTLTNIDLSGFTSY
jgi:hypothetical protein